MKKKSYDLVLDCSITMAWCFEDESNAYSETILEGLKKRQAIVPTIWPLEVSNVLLLSKKHKRITDVEVASFVDALSALPIIVDQSTSTRALQSIYVLATQLDLTIYDSAYLELAIREKIPLITLDKQLIKAAKKLKIPTII